MKVEVNSAKCEEIAKIIKNFKKLKDHKFETTFY